MKKKWICLIVSVCMLFSSCGGLVNAGNNNTNNTSSQHSESAEGSDSSDSENTEENEASDSSDNLDNSETSGSDEDSENSENSESAEDSETSEGTETDEDCAHVDGENDGVCDECYNSVISTVDLFAINDLHGKFADNDSQPGVDELTTYLKNAKANNENTFVFSSGDMWQGCAESNLTKGKIVTDWMNEAGFVAMTLGNHEYDWGSEAVVENAELAQFPFLAINVYDRETNQRVSYCDASIMIEQNGVKIGLIGAIGDCYSSISSDKTQDIYFKTGTQLTALVKAESEKLRSQGADLIVYSLHDGYEDSASGTQAVSASEISSYYDISLSKGYVDVVFEGHTHQNYVLLDSEGVYHLQGGGDNDGISHAKLYVNTVTDSVEVEKAEYVPTSRYASLQDDPIVAELLEKYSAEISMAGQVLGNNSRYRSSTVIRKLVAQLYYEKGMEVWGEEYDIALGGGFISVRSPYALEAGQVIYGNLVDILPFNNPIVLCRISGKKLKDKFFESTNSNYYIHYGEYGEALKDNINLATAYYVVTDTYTLQYTANGLTEVARLDETTYARDLVAEYIKKGGFA